MNKSNLAGQLIRKHRQNQQLSLKQLSLKSNISLSMLSRLESGQRRSMSVFNVKKVADALNMELKDFFDESIGKDSSCDLADVLDLEDVKFNGKTIRADKKYLLKKLLAYELGEYNIAVWDDERPVIVDIGN